ncbi:MAG: CNNM domain-containing protein [Steroidobacteraceae bacterium]
METAPTAALIGALVFLLALIAFSSGTEVAMLSVNRYRIRHRAAAGSRAARILERLLDKPDDWLGANLVVLTIGSFLASSVATLLALRSGHELALAITAVAFPVVMLVFCELAPKIFAALHPEGVALGSSYIYQALVVSTRWLLWLANEAAYGLLRLFGVRRGARASQALSKEELRTVVAEAGPMVPPRHRQMLLSILDLERVAVDDIMVPRQEISGIDLDDDWDDILDQLKQKPHTRLPVYRGELDNLVGILHMKRVAHELARGTLDKQRLEEITRSREPYFVPSGTTLMQQLTQFQRNRRRHAFVVNEYGDIEGLVTLEDLLEEIVGEFTTDPVTVSHKDIHRESATSYIINASATLRALNRALGWQLPTDGAKTLNGLLLEQLETIPETGTSVQLGDYRCEVLQVADNSVKTVRVRTTT